MEQTTGKLGGAPPLYLLTRAITVIGVLSGCVAPGENIVSIPISPAVRNTNTPPVKITANIFRYIILPFVLCLIINPAINLSREKINHRDTEKTACNVIASEQRERGNLKFQIASAYASQRQHSYFSVINLLFLLEFS